MTVEYCREEEEVLIMSESRGSIKGGARQNGRRTGFKARQ
jgi:hypothetical protein